MRLLIKDRGKGKTTGLIYASEATGYPIATGNEVMVDHIKQMAKEMNCNIPEPITFYELKKLRDNSYSTVLLDEVTCILEDALSEYLGTNVICATMTDNLKISEQNKGNLT